MIKAGVIGFPIGHSKSPLIHGYWLRKYGIEGVYEKYAIDPSSLKRDVATLVDDGLSGFNVTVPHKQAIMEFCSELSLSAERIGAVNLVTVQSDGSLSGDNSDGFGFIENVKDSVSGFSFSGKTALVLGAGGAACAVVDALLSEGIAQIIIANRTFEKANILAKKFSMEASEWEWRNDLAGSADFIVNTTSLGMKGQPPLDIDLGNAREDAVVADIVYAPLETDLLKQAKTRNLRTVTGIGMLLHQARPAFARWFGVMPDVDPELRTLVLKD